MKKILLLFTLLLVVLLTANAQKKVAVVTFYVVKKIGVTEFGTPVQVAVTQLVDDPNFNMVPLLKNFHEQFFNTYSKEFPFQLQHEDEIISNAEYKAFNPAGENGTGILKDYYNVAYDGYK